MFRDDYSLDYDNDEIIKRINDYLYKREDIASAYIFGSFDTENFNSQSDIDIAILSYKDISYNECLKINSELEDIIGLPIDLNNIESLPEYIQVQVIMNNRQLFGKDDLLEQKYIDKLNHWIKTEMPFWKKLVME